MRMVQCKACGKHYNYEQDEFCPKCGAYNPPQSTPAAGSGQQKQPLPKAQPTAKAQQPGESGQAACSTPEAWSRKRPSPAQNRTTVAKPAWKRGVILLAIVIVIIAVVVVAVSTMTVLVAENSTGGWRIPEAEEAAAISDTEGLPAMPESAVWREPWEEFSLNSVMVTVEDSWWLETPTRYVQEGYDCLAVDVWITGGTPQTDLLIDTPRILLSDGTQIPLNDDPFLARELSTQSGIYAVSLRDYQWEDPLFGSFIFFVPQGEEELALLIDEYAPGDPENAVLQTTYYIPLAPF